MRRQVPEWSRLTQVENKCSDVAIEVLLPCLIIMTDRPTDRRTRGFLGKY